MLRNDSFQTFGKNWEQGYRSIMGWHRWTHAFGYRTDECALEALRDVTKSKALIENKRNGRSEDQGKLFEYPRWNPIRTRAFCLGFLQKAQDFSYRSLKNTFR